MSFLSAEGLRGRRRRLDPASSKAGISVDSQVLRGRGEGRTSIVIFMTMRNEADEASVTYIDADGTPIEAPSGLDADAGRTGSGARTSMFAHLNDAVEEPSLAEAMKAMWRAGMAWATFVFVIGLLMVVLSSGLVVGDDHGAPDGARCRSPAAMSVSDHSDHPVAPRGGGGSNGSKSGRNGQLK